MRKTQRGHTLGRTLISILQGARNSGPILLPQTQSARKNLVPHNQAGVCMVSAQLLRHLGCIFPIPTSPQACVCSSGGPEFLIFLTPPKPLFLRSLNAFLPPSRLILPYPVTPVARMKPMKPSTSGVSSPSPPPHKLELQTLKLEELTVSLGCSSRPRKPLASALEKSVWIVVPPQSSNSISSPCPSLRSQSFGSSCACGDSRCPGPKRCSWSACVVAPHPENGRSSGGRTKTRLLLGRALGPRRWELPGGPAR